MSDRLPRLARADWLRLGLEAVRAPHPEALTVESLCQAAGRTRGSFYHHFAGVEDFLEAVLDSWEASFTDRLIAEAGREPEPGRKLHALDALAALLDRDVEQGVRRLAGRLPAMAPRIARVDARRIAFLESLYAGLALSPEDTAVLARVEYAAFLGFQQLEPAVIGRSPAELYAHYLKMVLAASPGAAPARSRKAKRHSPEGSGASDGARTRDLRRDRPAL
jgi:AcrR family transcriptional regulator